jgi:apolipoprotein N-acyltransferase
VYEATIGRFGVVICYESAFEDLPRRYRAGGAQFLVNITNDAWFGRTAEPHQHLALAVFRSVEHRLEMLRAVNTGVTAHIDAAGRVLAQTASVDPAEAPTPEAVTLLTEVALLEAGGVYRTVGDLFGLFCLAALVGGILFRGRLPSLRAARGRMAR